MYEFAKVFLYVNRNIKECEKETKKVEKNLKKVLSLAAEYGNI